MIFRIKDEKGIHGIWCNKSNTFFFENGVSFNLEDAVKLQEKFYFCQSNLGQVLTEMSSINEKINHYVRERKV